MKHTHIYKLFGISIVFSLFSVSLLQANVVNTISVSSNSGGNIAENGEIIEGKSKSSIDIVTRIQDEVVEEIHETSTNGSLYIENTVISNDGESTSQTKVYTDEYTQSDEVLETSLEENKTREHISTNIINSLSEEANDSDGSEFYKNYSLFATLFINFSRTINYVLSNLI